MFQALRNEIATELEVAGMKHEKIKHRIGINMHESSTLRGVIWVAVAVVGTVMTWFGKDVSQIVLLGAGIAGGLGVAIKDQ